MDFFGDERTVIVVDAVLAEGDPGTVYRIPTDRLLDLGPEVTPTAHEVDPIHLVEAGPCVRGTRRDGLARDRSR